MIFTGPQYKAITWGEKVDRITSFLGSRLFSLIATVKLSFHKQNLMLGGESVFWFTVFNLFLITSFWDIFYFSIFTKFPRISHLPRLICPTPKLGFPRFTFYLMFCQVPSFQHGNSQFFYSPHLRITSNVRGTSDRNESIECHLLFYKHRFVMKGNILYMLNVGKCNMKTVWSYIIGVINSRV